ncbi:MAG TPA: hypothetical protein VFE10_03755 [Phenylobacterium sp.]|jgi:hypothetical protein|nr:hypothetical protein [Phenylobacterium sp.]
MSNHRDLLQRDPSVAPAKAKAARNTASWWVAAVLAIMAVAGALAMLGTTRPSPEKLQAAHDQGVAEAQVDDAAYGRQLAVAHAAQAAAAGRTQTTEMAAQSAAANAGVVAQDASVTAVSTGP